MSRDVNALFGRGLGAADASDDANTLYGMVDDIQLEPEAEGYWMVTLRVLLPLKDDELIRLLDMRLHPVPLMVRTATDPRADSEAPG